MSKDLKDILYTSFYFLLVLCLVYLVVTYVGQRIEVVGSSMSPTLENEDNMLVDKLSYRFHEPNRFDIVVFPYKYEPNVYYIKRVIGLPGETVLIDEEGNIYIDGVILDEKYGKEVIKNPGLAYEPVTLGKNEYFVMGDNRNKSSDSRDGDVGFIKKSQIYGKALVRYAPFKEFKLLTTTK